MIQFLKGLLLENLGIKLVALLLAIALYLHVYTERPATMTVSFPLALTDLADTLALAGPLPEPVHAELKGTGKQLIRLRLSEPRVKISLAGVGPGHFERALTAEDLPLLHDEGLQVERFAGPRVIDLEIDRKLVRRLPPVVSVSGAPRVGWGWKGGYVIDPRMVSVSGPRREVARLDSVRLVPVRVVGRADSVRALVGADSLPPGCVMDPAQVGVVVALVRTAGAPTAPR